MKKISWVVTWVGIAVIGSGAVLWVVNRNAPGPAGRLESAQALYRCPMHPEIVSDKPGECPICHMRLERVEGPDAASSVLEPSLSERAVIQIDARKQQLIGVKSETVQKRALVRTIRTVGRVAYDGALYEAQENYLKARLQSRLGQKPPLGTIDPKAYTTYTKKWGLPQQEEWRAKLLFMGMNDATIEDLWRAGEPDKRLLFPKENDEIWVYAELYEHDLPFVKAGDLLKVESHTVGVHAEGLIRAVGTVVDPASRTVIARALVPNPQRLLTPEMFLDAAVRSELGEALVVPEEALLRSGTQVWVFVEREHGHFDPRRVVTGRVGDGFVEIQEGLSEGEKVVTSGNFLVDSESRLKAALSAFGEHVHKEE